VTIVLIALITMSLGSLSVIMVTSQRALLRESAEARAQAIVHTFAMLGGAAVVDNLFRVQEGFARYVQDPDVRAIEIVDPEGLVVASTNPARIGTALEDPQWVSMRAGGGSSPW